ncbi:hypothetical protein PHYSODRAFT_520803 [Phytophthora sojae]|uniref:Uncharacterized protein n=1 Tax=Phytophthora sojae (strain P6497) TaxID=1094619 RepID=G5A212_PHYSP|nr:hypothetical protein PHYSODRAFT_520803 [Phytophthora sojae]EGZ10960.1 hypothetical protein PHYSODRAFT_520803 [Phytophthora sojae]|eukprot:XP_009533705.1 hypothetical protein PHYSODRAFT_520803 [Phytophthora sojae]
MTEKSTRSNTLIASFEPRIPALSPVKTVHECHSKVISLPWSPSVPPSHGVSKSVTNPKYKSAQENWMKVTDDG